MTWLDRRALATLLALTSLTLTACGTTAPSSAPPTSPAPSPAGALITPAAGPGSPVISPRPLVSPVGPSPSPTARPEFYIVREGDTLSGIAARFGTTVEALMQANRLADPNQIESGRRLVIPR